MKLVDYNTTFVHIKGKNNVLADAISRLKTLNIYIELLENPTTPAVSNTQGYVTEVSANEMPTVSDTMLCTEQKRDIMCKKLASQLCHSINSSFKSVKMSENGIPQKHQYTHGLKHDIAIALHSLVPTMLHEFYDFKAYQGTICTFEVIRRSYWWPKLWQDIVKYIGKCSVCTKQLPNMARYPHQHLEVPQIPMAELAMDTKDCLLIILKGNRWALIAICLHTWYVFAISTKKKSAENLVQADLSGILAHKGGSVAILSDHETEF